MLVAIHLLSRCWQKYWNISLKLVVLSVEYNIKWPLASRLCLKSIMKMISFHRRKQRASSRVYSHCDWVLWGIFELNMQISWCSLWILISSPLFEISKGWGGTAKCCRTEPFRDTPPIKHYIDPTLLTRISITIAHSGVYCILISYLCIQDSLYVLASVYNQGDPRPDDRGSKDLWTVSKLVRLYGTST